MIVREIPSSRQFICPRDNASKGNPGPSVAAICIKNSERIILGVKGMRIIDFKNLITEVVTVVTFREWVQFCRDRGYIRMTNLLCSI